MTARLLDGRAAAAALRSSITQRVEQRTRTGLPRPGLAVVLVGDDPPSEVYVRNKRKACEEVNFRSYAHDLPAKVAQPALLDLIKELNQDPAIHGILVQLPLPPHIDTEAVIECIDPNKDVDGFHPYNIGRLASGLPLLRPCTPYGVMALLAQAGEDLAGRDAVVVGHSNIVGRPMALELLLAECTVTVCHRLTRDLAAKVKGAELLVVSVGKPGLVPGEWIRPGAIVVDVGINRTGDGTLIGDVEFSGASKRAAWITPVPGGVGPMTVATLLANTMLAVELKEQGERRAN